MPPKKKNVKKLTKALKNLEITGPSTSEAAPISTEENQAPERSKTTEQSSNKKTANISLVFNEAIDPKLSTKWPKYKDTMPPIFLHRPAEFHFHARKLVISGIQFYKPHKGRHQTRIQCLSLDDFKALIGYFDKSNLPYHTFGLTSRKRIKFVIRGVPDDIDLIKLKKAFISASVPVVRIHKMHRKYDVPGQPILLLVVVPYVDEGKKILKLKEISGSAVKIEKPIDKPKQCYRCQKWGHAQRYCRGEIHCVKCGKKHLTKKCPRDKSKEPPRCVNCGRRHTASYKLCSFCPTSQEYQQTKRKGSDRAFPVKPRIVTVDDCNEFTIKCDLYCNVNVKQENIINRRNVFTQ